MLTAGIAALMIMSAAVAEAASDETGAIEATATDTLTGAPISKFCAQAFGGIGRGGCTENGVLTLSDLPPGEYSTLVDSDPDYFDDDVRVRVTSNQTATVAARLAPTAKIAVTVVDANTKAPVQDACVHAKTGIGSFHDLVQSCTGPDGTLTITNLTTGAYNLWVQPRDTVHGAQWVGTNGGTGSRLLAKTVNAVAGKTVTVPPILLDGAGSISGTVVDSTTNAPVAAVCAFPRAGRSYDGAHGHRPNCTKQDGRYTMSGLGPYHWPVNFIDNVGSYGWQWSGDQPSQLTATTVKVHVGQTATSDAHLSEGSTVTGKVVSNGVDGDLRVFNAITGDAASDYTFADADGNYTLKNVAGNQLVKVAYTDLEKPPYNQYWYRDATTFGSARPIPVRAGTPVTGIDFAIQPR